MKHDVDFGGISQIYFGDLMQLKPCKGKYIWQEPVNPEFSLVYNIKSHWETFEYILLEENHRQGNDKEYADMLNRIRVGKQTEKDIEVLSTRVRPYGHPDTKGALFICCTNKEVTKHNTQRLNELDGDIVALKAITYHKSLPNFHPKPHKTKGTIANTPFLDEIQLKIGCRVMLILNLNTSDGLTNGTRGTLRNVVKDRLGNVKTLMIEYDNANDGYERRQNYKELACLFPGATPNERVHYPFQIGSKKSTDTSNSATLYQFPVIVCYASTGHRFQGQTVEAPQKVVIDIRSAFQPAMAYVMLSRIQS